MLLKTISSGCGVRASLMLFYEYIYCLISYIVIQSLVNVCFIHLGLYGDNGILPARLVLREGKTSIFVKHPFVFVSGFHILMPSQYHLPVM